MHNESHGNVLVLVSGGSVLLTSLDVADQELRTSCFSVRHGLGEKRLLSDWLSSAAYAYTECCVL